MLFLRLAATAAIALALKPCSGSSFSLRAHATSSPLPLVTVRPFRLDVPPFYDPRTAAPLLLALHGYGRDSADCGSEQWFLSALARAHGAFIAYPDGTMDATGHRFWNATDACCNFGSLPVDDVAYLTAVIDDVAARYRIDPARVWVAGISNGGFMAHRLACERADRIAAIVSFAGAGWADASRCSQGAPVSVLEVHGADDEVVPYEGSATLLAHPVPPYPSVEATVAESAAKNGCRGDLVPLAARVGFDGDRPSVATEIARWTQCPPGVDVERWKMLDARHVPNVTRAWADAVAAWLEQHPKR